MDSVNAIIVVSQFDNKGLTAVFLTITGLLIITCSWKWVKHTKK